VKILYLAHRLPYPPNKGDKIRSFHEVEYLSRRHRVWCACFVDDRADLSQVEGLGRYCEAVAAIPLNRTLATTRGLWRLALGGTLTEGFYDDGRMWRTVKRWSGEIGFDAVVVFSSSMAPYGLACLAGRRVIDFCDWDSRKWADYAVSTRGPKRRLFALEGRRLARREAEWAEAYDACAIITEAEAAQAGDPAVQGRVTVVGNGVAVRPLRTERRDGRPVVGFLGAMDYRPNVDAVRWFAGEVWPLIRRQVPQAVFRIAGRNPNATVVSLARRAGVEVVGEVPDAGACLEGFTVSVAPLGIARGLQNKVLEAMAAARPVVLTSAAAAGIEATDGEHYIVADGAEATTAAVVSLLDNPGLRADMGQQARAFVERRFDWDREMARLEVLLVEEASGTSCPKGPTGAAPRRSLTPALTASHHRVSSDAGW
jgi:sugar transferase (PEP-CTERM/EpsH1 system associated)